MRKYLSVLAILLGGGFVLSGISIFVIQEAMRNPGTASLPTRIADHPLRMQQGGRHATDEFNRLHQQVFPLIAGSVGIYGPNQEVKLWIGETFLNPLAGKMIFDMRSKIALGNSPFTPSGEQLQNGRTVHALDGIGQKHFYFQSGKMIIWLAVDENIAGQALKDTLEFYP